VGAKPFLHCSSSGELTFPEFLAVPRDVATRVCEEAMHVLCRGADEVHR